jgi:cysteine desulfurase
MLQALRSAYGNPSSGHSQGEPARRLLADARASLQRHLDTPEENFVFTGSGTEANNLGLKSLARQTNCIITSSIEHSSILNHSARLQSEGAEVVRIPATPDGKIELGELRQQLITHPKASVSIQWVNNETGVVQPIAEVCSLARKHGALIHIDAAQAIGKTNVSIRELDPDFVSFTAHKFNGPAGVGVLYARDPELIDPICFGGGQQGGRHGGTENIAGISGLNRALELRYEDFSGAVAQMRALRDRFEQLVIETCPWVHINGHPEQRICNTTNLRFEGIDGQALIGRLDALSVFCSQTSACTAGQPEPSYVLRSMGLSEDQAYASVRFSFGVTNTEEEIERAAQTVAAEADYLKRIFE